MYIPALILVAVLVGVPLWFYVVFLRRAYRARDKKHLTLIVGVPLVLGIVLLFQWRSMNEWEFRKKLPWSAKNVHEWSHEDGFLPDYTYFLRAELSKEQFRAYAESLKLESYDPKKAYRPPVVTPPWTTRGPMEWWNPTAELDGAFVAQIGTDNWTIAKYENGCVYLYSIEW